MEWHASSSEWSDKRYNNKAIKQFAEFAQSNQTTEAETSEAETTHAPTTSAITKIYMMAHSDWGETSFFADEAEIEAFLADMAPMWDGDIDEMRQRFYEDVQIIESDFVKDEDLRDELEGYLDDIEWQLGMKYAMFVQDALEAVENRHEQLNAVLTASEIEDEFGLSEGTVRKYMQYKSDELETMRYVRKSGSTWLILREFAERQWGKRK